MSLDNICGVFTDVIAFSCSQKRGIDVGLGRGYSGSQVKLHVAHPSDNVFMHHRLLGICWACTRLAMQGGQARDKRGWVRWGVGRGLGLILLVNMFLASLRLIILLPVLCGCNTCIF